MTRILQARILNFIKLGNYHHAFAGMTPLKKYTHTNTKKTVLLPNRLFYR